MADAELVGQYPREGGFVDQAGCQQLRLEIGTVFASQRGEVGCVARRHGQAPQQRQPVVKFGKQVESEYKAVARNRRLSLSGGILERPFRGAAASSRYGSSPNSIALHCRPPDQLVAWPVLPIAAANLA